MAVTDQKLFQELAAKLDSCRQTQSNLLIITLPGLGASYLLQNYQSLHPETSYITQTNQPLTNFNLLDLNSDINPDFFATASSYFNLASPNQKFALVINSPSILESPTYQNSLIPRHFHSTFYLKCSLSSRRPNSYPRP